MLEKLIEKAKGREKPIVAISTGDPSGIGPEISASALKHRYIYQICRPFLIGDLAVFGAMDLGEWKLNPVGRIADMQFSFGTIDLLNMDLLESPPPLGVVDPLSGGASFQYVKKAIELAMAGQTSEEVGAVLGSGAFGAARETGEMLNAAICDAARRDVVVTGAGPPEKVCPRRRAAIKS